MSIINHICEDYWPCNLCYYFGWIGMIFTVGLSLLLPSICINQLLDILKEELDILNDNPIYAAKHVKWSLERRCLCCRSWIQITYLPNDI